MHGVAPVVDEQFSDVHESGGYVSLPEAQDFRVIALSERAAVIASLGNEQPRYFLQHALGFQIHDHHHPHQLRRHGRADIGWDTGTGKVPRDRDTLE